MRFAIVGCGLIGQKRSRSLKNRHIVTVASDSVIGRAEALAAAWPGARVVADWKIAAQDPAVDVVVVATTNDYLAPVTLAAIEANRPVIVEKPAARSATELLPVIEAARRQGVHVHVGFNHRYHPALQKARIIHDSGAIGPLMFVRGRYGHGGRLGYEREWRANPEIAGGGELLDQGVHLIDLARWFLGDFIHVQGHAHTYYWDMPVEDNGFLLLQTAHGQTAWLHATCTEWKNLFSFEIYGRQGKLQIDGLGGSYGVERLTHYQMLPQMGPPDTVIWEYPGEDRSWDSELQDFENAVAGKPSSSPGLQDALAALNTVERVYARPSL